MKLRIAELLGGLSLATDMGAGQPLQSAIAGAILATRLARRLGCDEEEQRDTYHAAILRFVGCSATAPESAQMGAGEDASFNFAFSMCDMSDPRDVERAMNAYWATRADPALRRSIIRAVVADLSGVAAAGAAHCAQAVVLSRRVPVGPRVSEALGHMYDRHDGVHSTASGEAIPVPARLCSLAAATAIGVRALGKRMALELVLPRSGGEYWPEACALLDADREALLDGLDAPSCWDAYLDAEPGEQATVSRERIDEVCSAYGDYGDQKSGYLLGHSRQVASLGFIAGDAAGLDLESRRRLRLAALLHDVGRAGVATGLWDKRGALNAHERRLVETHNAHTETVLALAPGLCELSQPATSAHERTDRSGYPGASPLAEGADGLLAAADVYQALTSDRPWREAYPVGEAADLLLAEAREGKLPRRAVHAVLDAAGHGKRASQEAYPARLSEREVEVLALLAQGRSTKQIASRLGVAPKTAENHVGRIYDKTGARGRAAAALFAVEHGLVGEPPSAS